MDYALNDNQFLLRGGQSNIDISLQDNAHCTHPILNAADLTANSYI